MRRKAALAILPLLTLPLAIAQAPQQGPQEREEDVVTFYGHVFSHGWDAPMPANTEFPVGEDNYGLGFFNTGCWLVGIQECRWTDNTMVLVLFSTAGFVDVEDRSQFASEGGYALLHNERGHTKDIRYDPDKSIRAGLWFTIDRHGWPVGGGATNCPYPHPPDVPCLYPYWGWDPGIVPDVVLEATLAMAKLGEHGANASDAPPILEAVENDEHTVIATGKLGPTQVINGLPGYENVYEYVVDLGAPQLDRVPRDQNIFLVYDMHRESSGQAYEFGEFRLWGGEFFPPWFTVPATNPIDVERVIPIWAHGQLSILAIMNTPWGSYDVRDAQMRVEGPGGLVTPQKLLTFDKSSVAHGGHYIPVNKTWVWDVVADGLEPGDYTVTVDAVNWQGSARASCAATFVLAPNEVGRIEARDIREGVCGEQSLATGGLAEQLEEEVR